MQKKIIGDKAEAIALSWLETQGYRFIQRNYVRRVGEIDLIVKHPDEITIVFIEVRYRSSERYGGALSSVTRTKQQRLVRTANAWLQRYATSATPARIDIIAMRPEHIGTMPTQLWMGHQLDWIQNAIEE